MRLVGARTLGEGWLAASPALLESGADAAYDGQAAKEPALLTLTVAEPDPADAPIASFAERDDAAEPGDARSDARGLRDFGGLDHHPPAARRHALDFGKKPYSDLVELARLQHESAAAAAASRPARSSSMPSPRACTSRNSSSCRGSWKYACPSPSFDLTSRRAAPLDNR